MKKYLFVLYGFLIIGFTLFTYLYVDVNISSYKSLYTGFSIANRNLSTAVYILFLFLFFVFYMYFLVMASQKKITFNSLKKVIVLLTMLIFAYPAILSFDLFNYMTTAKVICHYGENPYLVMPIEFIGDPVLLYTRAANKIALYGPSWVMATCVPYLLGFSNFLLTIFLFKTVPALCYFGICYSIYNLSKKNLFSLVFFALNPLVIIETFVSGHNDLYMIFFALLSIHFLTTRKIWKALAFIFISVLVKYATLFLLPVAIYIAFHNVIKKEVKLNKVWLYSLTLLLIPFLLSPLREEMYPWYALWLIPFAALLVDKKKLQLGVIALSFGLMLTYIPYMLTGMYHGVIPLVRNFILATSVIIFFVVVSFFKKNKWVF